tara:strand:- start:4050 stop:4433 length:384 start_codon:yes stop_codon:yes gene_type:complete
MGDLIHQIRVSDDDPSFRISTSAGITEFRDTVGEEQMMIDADQALGYAIAEGGHRVAAHVHPDKPAPAADAETPAADAEAPAAGAETPAAGAETPPASAETPPASAETPAASAETPDPSAGAADPSA